MSTTEDASKDFDFVQCWTCKSLIYDMSGYYKCLAKGKEFKTRGEIATPTDCEDWKRV